MSLLWDFTSKHTGLDFGAGTGPVISKVLKDNEYKIKQFDPFFHNYPELLKEKYDYIVCCEVMEHFYDPAKEFAGIDEQLNKAIEVILEELKTKEKELPPVPPYPKKKK